MKSSLGMSVEGLTILNYSDFGTGKTWFLRTCPRVLVLDFDRGMRTNRDVDVAYIDGSEISSTDKLLSIIRRPPNLSDGKPPLGIAIDSLTAFIDEVAIPEIKSNRQEMRIQDWGTLYIKLQTIFILGKEIAEQTGRYFIVNSHREGKEDKATQEIIMGPAIPGGMFWKAGRHFDLYLQFDHHPTKHSIVRFRGGKSRDRLRIVVDGETPDMSQWLEALKGE